jgi:hypothetical protein
MLKICIRKDLCSSLGLGTRRSVFVGKTEAERPLGTLRHRWENNIKIDFREIGWGGMDWIALAECRDVLSAPVKTVMHFSEFRKILGNS